jgi:RNA polymerase II subunit A small phosphatase-like protein
MKHKINIILDLDNTLISSVTKTEHKQLNADVWNIFQWKNMDGFYDVFERPNLQKFLDFLFAHFNVSVWTAASKPYALFIVEKIILKNKPERKLDYIFFSYHCKQSKRMYKASKSLSILKKDFNIDMFEIKNTYIIDDHPDVYKTQCKQCISVKPFEITHPTAYQDSELLLYVKPILQSLLNK